MGADVSVTTMTYGRSALHYAFSLDILIALLDRGADPIQPNRDGELLLMWEAIDGPVDNVARLLEDLRVRANINVQDEDGKTALHHACGESFTLEEAAPSATPIVHLLLQAGANPTIADIEERLPLDEIRQHRPNQHAAIALLEQYPAAQKDAEKASFLVKARRLAVAANSNTVAPSCLQARVARGQLLPLLLLRRVVLMPMVGSFVENDVKGRKLHSFYAFVFGLGGPKGEGMPRDVFRVVMDLLMPSWDPLRRKNAGTGPPAQQG